MVNLTHGPGFRPLRNQMSLVMPGVSLVLEVDWREYIRGCAASKPAVGLEFERASIHGRMPSHLHFCTPVHYHLSRHYHRWLEKYDREPALCQRACV